MKKRLTTKSRELIQQGGVNLYRLTMALEQANSQNTAVIKIIFRSAMCFASLFSFNRAQVIQFSVSTFRKPHFNVLSSFFLNMRDLARVFQ